MKTWTRPWGWLLLVMLSVTLSVDGEAAGISTDTMSDRAFNPAISLILTGQFSERTNSDEVRDVPGFQLGEEAGEFSHGFALGESELNLQANIDDKFFGASTIAFAVEEGESVVEIEEAYLQTLALPAGWRIKAGRFYSGAGYLNSFHIHATAFYDDPLPYRIFFGGRLADTGMQVTWTAPTLLYWQVGGEYFAGDSFPAAGSENQGKGMRTVFTRLGGDVNQSNSWLASIGYVSADAAERSSGGTAEVSGADPLFSGDSDILMGSFVWKWAPLGNPRNRSFRFTAEYLQRDEKGTVSLAPLASGYDGDHKSFYAEGVYRFSRQWRVGLRFDAATADNRIDAAVAPVLAADDDSHRISAAIDFWNSEFSTIRLQVTNDRSNPRSDTAVVLQYIMIMGAHGGHTY